MKWTTTAVIVAMFAGVAYAQNQAPAEKPYSPEQQQQITQGTLKALSDQVSQLNASLLQQQQVYAVEHKLRLDAESSIVRLEKEIADMKAPKEPAKDAPK